MKIVDKSRDEGSVRNEIACDASEADWVKIAENVLSTLTTTAISCEAIKQWNIFKFIQRNKNVL